MHVAVAKLICQLVKFVLHMSTVPATLCTRVARSILAKTFLALPFSRNLDELDRVLNAYFAADICIGMFIYKQFKDYIDAVLEYQELQEMEKMRGLKYVI